MKINKFTLFFILFITIAYNYTIAVAVEDVDTQTSIVTLTVPPSCKLSIANPDITKTLNQGGELEAAFDAGYIDFNAATPTLTVSANKSWNMNVKATDFTGPYKKSVSDLKLKDASTSGHVTNGFNNFTPLNLTGQEMVSSMNPAKNESHPIQYRIMLNWTDDIPGTYTSTVTYTLSTNAS
ncbi:MAG: hypothetical protein Q8N76_05520 [Candidatus Omnitrophota bacterium]|nr:hypothetical protein [Candidatus Omnitrophota bacterium]